MYQEAVIFVDKVEDMPNIVNEILLDQNKMNQISQNNMRFIIQKVFSFLIFLCIIILICFHFYNY